MLAASQNLLRNVNQQIRSWNPGLVELLNWRITSMFEIDVPG
jgi:hypothetical protein